MALEHSDTHRKVRTFTGAVGQELRLHREVGLSLFSASDAATGQTKAGTE